MSALCARSANTASEREYAAGRELAGLEVVHGGLHVLERIARRHQLVELEPALSVEVDIAAHISLRLRRPIAAAEHGLVEIHGCDVERDLSRRLGYAEHYARAAPVEQLDRRADQGDVADALEGVVDTGLRQLAHCFGALDEIGGAELQRNVPFPRVGVDSDDAARAGESCALDDVEADAPDADHENARTCGHAGTLQHRTDACQHAAPDQ